MKSRATASLLACCRGKSASSHRSLAKALRQAAGDAGLQQKLDEQNAFDDRMCAVIANITPPASLLAAGGAGAALGAAEPPHWTTALRQPAAIAALSGLLVILGVMAVIFFKELSSFQGQEAVAQILRSTGRLTGAEFEPIEMEAGGMADHFFLHGLPPFIVPEEFATFKTIAWRVFKQDGVPIAQVAVEDREMLFSIFRAVDLGVELSPPDRWHYVEEKHWSGAVRMAGDMGFLVAIRGTQEDLEAELDSL